MKKGCLILIFLISFADPAFCNANLPNPNNGLFFVAPRILNDLDGDLTEWYHRPPVVLDDARHAKYLANDWGGREDCSISFWWGWNEAGFLLAAEVLDDSISFPNAGDRIWANDCIQFTIDVLDDNSTESYRNDDHEFVVSMMDSLPRIYEFTFSDHRRSGLRPFPCVMQISNDTVRYELQIPWHALGMTGPEPGRHIGASLVAFDNDGEDYRGHVEWTTGIVDKKFTLPYANILLFDPGMKMIQSIAAQPFLSENDTLVFWSYTGFWRRNLTCRLLENSDVLFTDKYRLTRGQWKMISIPPKYIKSGQLSLEIVSKSVSKEFNIAVWSKTYITNQLTYLFQQNQVLGNLKGIDQTAHMLVKYWAEWLQRSFSAAQTNFDYFNVMQQAQKRIDLIPNFYMNQEVFYNREYRIVEKMYFSQLEASTKRYLAYLPPEYKKDINYPLVVALGDQKEDAAQTARKLSAVLSENDVQMIAMYPNGHIKNAGSNYFFSDMLEQLSECRKNFRIDSTRIYLIAETRNAHDAIRLVQKYPDKFAALSIISEDQLKPEFITSNLNFTPLHLWAADKDSGAYTALKHKISEVGSRVDLKFFPWEDHKNTDELYTARYFDWLLQFKNDLNVKQITLHVDRMQPSAAFWLQVDSQNDYGYKSIINAVLDSSKLYIREENICALSIIRNRLPDSIQDLSEIKINSNEIASLEAGNNILTFRKVDDVWQTSNDSLLEINSKNHMSNGPIAAVFNHRNIYVFSTGHADPNYNNFTRNLAEKSSCRGDGECLQHLVLADTVALKRPIDSNMMIFGNENANRWLQQFSAKLPIQTRNDGNLRFGKSIYYGSNNSAIYIYPNPLNRKYFMLICTAENIAGLENIKRMWHMGYSNNIFNYDYVFIDDRASTDEILTAVDYGYFNNDWDTPWYKNRFRIGPKRWFTNVLLGLDANQLSFNSNWKGGGKGSFTWKVYLRSGLDYKRKSYHWLNSIYCAFGQISLQERESWRSPEKSNDTIDFDSVFRFKTKQFIDPYISFTLNTQFQDGFDPKTKALVSGFLNPLQLTMSTGITKNLIKQKRMALITRLGSGVKEVIVRDIQFRKRWTGDISRGVKSHGGVEWTTELNMQFNKSVRWNNKLKLFQAMLSSISRQKDPNKNWRHLDVYFEQTLTVQFNKYILLNMMAKFLYDRDTSSGGQFLENASLGLSYRFSN